MVVSSKKLNELFNALSHPTRRQILVILHAREGLMNAGEIADRFKHSWPTITRHLGVLQSAGLIAVRTSGRERIYELLREPALAGADWIVAWAAERAQRSEKPGEWKSLEYANMRNATKPKQKRPKANKTKTDTEKGKKPSRKKKS